MDELLRQKIIQELALKGVSDETVDKVITTLGGLILQTVVTRLAEKLSSEQMNTLEELIQKGNQEALSTFLEKNVDNFNQLVEDCSKELVEEYKKL